MYLKSGFQFSSYTWRYPYEVKNGFWRCYHKNKSDLRMQIELDIEFR